MKVILTNTEACNAVASHYNVHPHEVEIEGKPLVHYPTMLQDGIACPHVRDALRSLFDEGARVGRDGSRNKIAMIKAIRTLTDCNLKEGKDFVEMVLLNEF